MATIEIRREHKLGKDAAKAKAEELAKGLESKLELRWKWDGDRIRFDAPSGMAKGTTGTVIVEASAVRVEVDLPFLLRPMKGTVESKIKERLEALLG